MIFWEMLLKTDDTKRALTELYEEFGGVAPLAMHLGISRSSLLNKMKELGIERRKPGGPHFRVERQVLPDRWWNMDTDTLVRVTGYTPNYVRRLRREKLCELAATTKTQQAVSSSDSKGTPSESSK
jgi:hypothetical protein